MSLEASFHCKHHGASQNCILYLLNCESAVPIQCCFDTGILQKLYVSCTDAWTSVAYVSIRNEQGRKKAGKTPPKLAPFYNNRLKSTGAKVLSASAPSSDNTVPCVMKLCLPICVHVAVSLTICICPGLRASVHAMMLCACVVCLVFIFACRLFTITSDACACACGLRAYHYLLAALLIIT